MPDLETTDRIVCGLAIVIYVAQADLEDHGAEKAFDDLPIATQKMYIDKARQALGLG